MSAVPEAVLSLRHVSLEPPEVGRHVPSLDLCVQRAEIVVVLGVDAGLVQRYLRNMAALEMPAKGAVEIMGLPAATLGRAEFRKLRSRIGYLIGDSSLLPIHNGLINVMLPALYHRRDTTFREVSRTARGLLEEMGCDFNILALPHYLGTFQQRLIQLARALILEPDILYLEEPFHDLAVEDRRSFSEILLKMRSRVHSGSIILSTDSLEVVSRLGGRIVFVDPGFVEVFPDWRSLCKSQRPEIAHYLEEHL